MKKKGILGTIFLGIILAIFFILLLAYFKIRYSGIQFKTGNFIVDIKYDSSINNSNITSDNKLKNNTINSFKNGSLLYQINSSKSIKNLSLNNS